MEIQFLDIYEETGDQVRRRRKNADEFCASAAVKGASAIAEVHLLFHWPRDYDEFLELMLSGLDAQGSDLDSVQDQAKIEAVTRRCGLQIPPGHRVHHLKLRRTDEVLLDLTVKTGHPGFKKAVAKILAGKNAAPGGDRRVADRPANSSESPKELVMELGIRVASAVLEVKGVGEIPVTIRLAPLYEPPVFPGVVAVDLGNSTTTIASMSHDAEAIDEIRLIDIRTTAAHDSVDRPIPTVLRVTGFKNPPGLAVTGNPPAAGARTDATDPLRTADLSTFTCLIGEEATRTTNPAQQRRVLYGAKPLLADLPGDAGILLELDRRSLRCRRRLLAELFLTETLRGFIRSEKQRPERVVITCPTSFTPREHHNLKEAFSRAWWRVRGMRGSEQSSPRSTDGFIANVIDEASAAAFYFVYRDVISEVGHVPAFRYTYQYGLNALLIDCGGGTTDIALVRATPKSESEIDIQVLGRAGNRSFGGNYITKQLFRLLKAKLLLASPPGDLAADLVEPPGDDWTEFLQRHDREMERFLPTRFDPTHLDDIVTDRRRQATYLLWTLAEAYKRTLSASELPDSETDSDDQAAKVKVDDRFEVQLFHVRKHCRNLSEHIPSGVENAFNLASGILDSVRVKRSELNRLIEAETRRTIGYANHLIGRLRNLPTRKEGDTSPPGIERVYVVGNASLYPYIRQMLIDPQHGLHVPFLTFDPPGTGAAVPRNPSRSARTAQSPRTSDSKEAVQKQNRQVLVDMIPPEDMKGAVAKGAVLAQRVRIKGLSVAVTWDHDLINKLPYSIIHKGFSYPNGYKLLYQEGTRYEDCVGGWLDQMPDKASGKPTVREIPLHLLWPGDTDLDSALLFATFEFKAPVAGRLDCDFGEQDRFWLTAEDGTRVSGRPPEEPDGLGPVQSGKL